jgi:hypothetical protein
VTTTRTSRLHSPRLMLLTWSAYLLGGAAVSLGVAGAVKGGIESIRLAAAIFFQVAFAGLVVLWPMVRLSQRVEGVSPGSRVALDAALLLVTFQAVLWPAVMMARWPVDTGLVLCGLAGAWTLIAGAFVVAAAHFGARVRALVIALFVALTWAAPASMLVRQAPVAGGSAARRAPMWSPFTGAWEVTRPGRAGTMGHAVRPEQWTALGVLAAGSVAAWIAAVHIGARRRGAPGRDPGTEVGDEPHHAG